MAPDRAYLAITHVTVVNVENGSRSADRTVFVRDGKIISVDSARSRAIPAGAIEVDGRGRFLIPGLWDMHVHASWPMFRTLFGSLYVANGVTGVREMFGTVSDIDAWRAEVRDGRLVGPRMIGSGHIVDGVPPVWPGSVMVRTSEDGRRAVDSLADAGAAFIKVYNRLPREAYYAVTSSAQRRGIAVAGHVPDALTAREVAGAGQRSLEHMGSVAAGCSSRETLIRAIRDSASRDDQRAAALRLRASALGRSSFDQASCDSLFDLFRRTGTWQVPTLVVSRSISLLRDSALLHDPRMHSLPPALVRNWNWREDFRFRDLTEAGWADLGAIFRHNVMLVGLMARRSVPLLAGTDAPNPFVFPGSSLHEELALLVRAGASPLQALQAATINPARWFRALDSLGTVAPGKRADLVLLSADPLRRIENTQTIVSVVADGRLYDRRALDSLIETARRNVSR